MIDDTSTQELLVKLETAIGNHQDNKELQQLLFEAHAAVTQQFAMAMTFKMHLYLILMGSVGGVTVSKELFGRFSKVTEAPQFSVEHNQDGSVTFRAEHPNLFEGNSEPI